MDPMGYSIWSSRRSDNDIVHVRVLQVCTLEEACKETWHSTVGRVETISIRQCEVLRNEDDNTPDPHDVHGAHRNGF